jgi:hypothetical protein
MIAGMSVRYLPHVTSIAHLFGINGLSGAAHLVSASRN